MGGYDSERFYAITSRNLSVKSDSIFYMQNCREPNSETTGIASRDFSSLLRIVLFIILVK